MATQVHFGFDDKVYSSGTVAVLMDALAREGVPEGRVLNGSGLTPIAVRSPQARMSANQFVRVYHNALKLTHDPYFAFHVGQRMHLSVYRMYGFAILSSTSFRQAMHFAAQYYQLAAPLVEVSFREEHSQGVWSLVPAAHQGVDAGLSRYLGEFYVSNGISLLRDMFGASFVPLEVRFGFARPRYARKYEQLTGCPVLFGQEKTQLVFDASLLDREYEFGNEIAHSEAVKLCDELMTQLRVEAGLAGRVRQLLLVRQMPQKRLIDVARQLHLAPRTLRRRLREERTSFRKLVYELKMHMAMRYLRDTALSVEDVARALGFSEGSSFRRAFERWANVSPARFRSRLQGPGRSPGRAA